MCGSKLFLEIKYELFELEIIGLGVLAVVKKSHFFMYIDFTIELEKYILCYHSVFFLSCFTNVLQNLFLSDFFAFICQQGQFDQKQQGVFIYFSL